VSANETLDLAREEENIALLGDVYRAGPDFVRRLIAAVRERDAEIARLKLRNEFLSEALAAAGAIVHAEDQP